MARQKLVLPTCLGLAICDAVITDVQTRNKSLINMFNGILTPAVPARHDRMCVYVAFTGGRGRLPIALRLCHDAEYEKDLLPRMGDDVEFPMNNPHAVVDIVFDIRGFVFPRFGNYTFEILCDEVPLIARRFTVQRANAPGQPATTSEPSPPEEPPPGFDPPG